MKKILKVVMALVLALGMSVGSAETARIGGGKSVGTQRQFVARPPTTVQQAAPAAATVPVGAAIATSKRNWMGPLAGGTPGLGSERCFHPSG